MLEDCVPENMNGHVAVNMDHYILVFSGKFDVLTDNRPLDLHEIWAYNLYTERWRKHVIPQGQTVPATRIWACAVVIRSDVYMFGGLVLPESSTSNTLWKLATDPQRSFVWSKISATNKKKTPSPRACHTGWEYAEKLWTFGGWGIARAGFLNDHGEFDWHCNNQLLCFNPSNEEWTNPQCHGMVPEPHPWHTTTTSQEKVLLYEGRETYEYQGLYELNMHSYTWTLMQTKEMPQGYSSCTLSIISHDKLLLHGIINDRSQTRSNTWILDWSTKTWRQYHSGTVNCRSDHTCCRGINKSGVIIGGLLDEDQHQSTSRTIFHVLMEPKSLLQLTMQTICKNHTVLPWKSLPRKLTVLLDIQETEDTGEASDLTTE